MYKFPIHLITNNSKKSAKSSTKHYNSKKFYLLQNILRNRVNRKDYKRLENTSFQEDHK